MNIFNILKMFIAKRLWKRSLFCVLIISAVLLAAAAVAAGVYLYWFYNLRILPPPPDTALVLPQVRNGDVILRSGVGLWSELFRSRNLKDKRFSHVGIVWERDDGSYSVIHAEGNDINGQGTVSVITLEKFVQESQCIGISRLHCGNPDLLVQGALKYLHRPFDWQFNSDDHQAIYCTELVVLALAEAVPEAILPRSENIILPESCLLPEYFTEISVELNSEKR